MRTLFEVVKLKKHPYVVPFNIKKHLFFNFNNLSKLLFLCLFLNLLRHCSIHF